MNTLTYIIYLTLTYGITVHVGRVFYKNGRHYLLAMLNGEHQLTDRINHVLLTGYYLLNLGYATLKISTWQKVLDWRGCLESVSGNIGVIVILLACIHYINMTIILHWRKIDRLLTTKKYNYENLHS